MVGLCRLPSDFLSSDFFGLSSNLEKHEERFEDARNKCIASSNKCLTSSNKKLLGARASIVVTRTLLVAPGIATNGAFLLPFFLSSFPAGPAHFHSLQFVFVQHRLVLLQNAPIARPATCPNCVSLHISFRSLMCVMSCTTCRHTYRVNGSRHAVISEVPLKT